MSLRDFWNRLRLRGPSGEKVELRPLEQVALALIADQEGASTPDVQAAIDARTPVLRQEAAQVLAALLEQGLAEARHQPESGAAAFVATARGRRLRRRLPLNPTTVTDFWL